MENEIRKKAIDMLLNGATLLSEPCPYCKGVRVMKDGNALCTSCGKKPKSDHKIKPDIMIEKNTTLDILEKKLNSISKELESESEPQKQQEILKSINLLIETIGHLKNNNKVFM